MRLTSKATAYSPRRTLGHIQWREHRRRSDAESSEEPTGVHDRQGAARTGLEGDAGAGRDAGANKGPLTSEAVGEEECLKERRKGLVRQ